jgi:hypothetical protein
MLRNQLRVVVKRAQIIGITIDDQNNIPSISPISSVRSSPGNILLTTKTHNTVTSISRSAINPNMIDK